MVKPHSLLSVAIGGPNSSLVPSPTSSSSLCWGLHFVIISSNNMTEIPLPWFYCQLQKEDSDKPYEETQLPICSHTLLTGKSKYQLKIVVNIFWTNSMVFLTFPGYNKTVSANWCQIIMKRREIHPEQHQDLGKGKVKKKTYFQGFHKLLRMRGEIYKGRLKKKLPSSWGFPMVFNF